MEFLEICMFDKKYIIYCAAAIVASEITWKIISRYRNLASKSASETDEQITDTIFFTDKGANCRDHAFSSNPCNSPTCPLTSVNKIISYLNRATETLDVCVYFLTCQAVCQAICNLKSKNIKVRIITDEESNENNAGQVNFLRGSGVEVKSRKSQFLMHHKFAIIDGKLLICGSANWTIQAFFGNDENIFITNDSYFTNKFSKEFERLWLKF